MVGGVETLKRVMGEIAAADVEWFVEVFCGIGDGEGGGFGDDVEDGLAFEGDGAGGVGGLGDGDVPEGAVDVGELIGAGAVLPLGVPSPWVTAIVRVAVMTSVAEVMVNDWPKTIMPRVGEGGEGVGDAEILDGCGIGSGRLRGRFAERGRGRSGAGHWRRGEDAIGAAAAAGRVEVERDAARRRSRR